MSVHLDRLPDYFRHVIDGVLTSEKTYAAIHQTIDATAVVVIFEELSQPGAKSHNLNFGLILSVMLQDIGSDIQNQRLLARIHVADL